MIETQLKNRKHPKAAFPIEQIASLTYAKPKGIPDGNLPEEAGMSDVPERNGRPTAQ